MAETGRSLGDDPVRVARLARAFARGLGSAGILAIGKHYPGYGPAQGSSDKALLHVDRSPQEIARHQAAFVAASDVLAGVMLANVAFTAYGDVPAILSPELVARAHLAGFLTVTDDLAVPSLLEATGGDAARALAPRLPGRQRPAPHHRPLRLARVTPIPGRCWPTWSGPAPSWDRGSTRASGGCSAPRSAPACPCRSGPIPLEKSGQPDGESPPERRTPSQPPRGGRQYQWMPALVRLVLLGLFVLSRSVDLGAPRAQPARGLPGARRAPRHEGADPAPRSPSGRAATPWPGAGTRWLAGSPTPWSSPGCSSAGPSPGSTGRLATAGLAGAHRFVAFLALTSLALGLVDLPFAWWRARAVEQPFGFGEVRLVPFLAARFRALAGLAALGLPLLYAAWAILVGGGEAWWLWLFAALAVLQLALQWALAGAAGVAAGPGPPGHRRTAPGAARGAERRGRLPHRRRLRGRGIALPRPRQRLPGRPLPPARADRRPPAGPALGGGGGRGHRPRDGPLPAPAPAAAAGRHHAGHLRPAGV